MNIVIMIPDEQVNEILASHKRVQGTILLANEKEGNFNVHHRHAAPAGDDLKELSLRCGKAIASKDRFHIHLNVRRPNEEHPKASIQDDLKEANDFFTNYNN